MTLLRATDSARPSKLYLVFLDVKKAFDSVSYESMILALHHAGLPEPLLAYLSGLYKNSWTRILADGKLSGPIDPTQGVRQGNPLSSFIFNAVMDWCLEKLSTEAGYDLHDELVSYLAFADALVLLARSQLGLAEQTNCVITALGTTGLKVNPGKCSTLTVLVNSSLKKWVVDQEPHLKIDSEFVPALGIEDAYKYLGLQIRAGGTIAQVRNKFIEQLKQIGRAPLKPQQRLWLLKSNSLPGLLHQLVLAKTTKKQLRSLDILVRKSVRGWLKLPHDTPVSYFHSDVKDSGLGIPCMLYDLPEKICQRLVKLQCSSDPIVAKIAAAQGFSDRLAKWSEPLYLDGNTMNSGKQL